VIVLEASEPVTHGLLLQPSTTDASSPSHHKHMQSMYRQGLPTLTTHRSMQWPPKVKMICNANTGREGRA
jgi:hypothetical protein